MAGTSLPSFIHEVRDDDGKTMHQRQSRGQRLAQAEALGKQNKECKPWKGDASGGFLSCDTVMSSPCKMQLVSKKTFTVASSAPDGAP